MADERSAFNLIDVLKLIKQKLIHRHPHVFGNTSVNGETEVLQNWESLKLKEGRTSMLHGVPISLP
jgi:XTP/dITP diphosphohydrolase